MDAGAGLIASLRGGEPLADAPTRANRLTGAPVDAPLREFA